ncbi:MAG: hypothetical protein L6Q63_02425 [Giesbergeria sp.]|nr:hypothetical protein [Giesbergeria sp.]
MSRKPTLCKQSAAVVAHLKQHGAATLDELLPHFADEGRSKLRKRLSNLVDGNWLDIAWDASGAMLWLVAPRARTALPTLPPSAPSAPSVPSAPPVLVPPRRINVMQGTYVPPPMTPARPGALDFQRYASRGFRC